jgi:hypothetical protein
MLELSLQFHFQIGAFPDFLRMHFQVISPENAKIPGIAV